MNTHQQGFTALITGANAGIGLALTKKLLSEGWQVAALNRSAFSPEDSFIQQALLSKQLRLYQVTDLTDYASLRTTLHTIQTSEQQIDIMFNNAGGSFPELAYSPQGREKHYELMTVVPYIILMELKDLLKHGRLKTVINTSSAVLRMTKKFSLEILEEPRTFRKLIGPYASSKLGLSLWTHAIAPQLALDNIKIRSVDPGSNNTIRKGKTSGLPVLVHMLMKLFFPPPAHGADKLYEGALGQHRDKTGVFISNNRMMELKYIDQAPRILERMHAIYKHEYLQT
ncbi:SDR family NAD(P)-dependent oxidoreductase [Paenibacillus cisolokensis]|uniref:SDR family NAD(P)-dependent oxidoreductase n=1 Tax=Paenibacillus cisolokensis TaxID=1658519 RepID=UPI003D2C73BF